MHHPLLFLCLVTLALSSAFAADLPYPPEVARWKEAAVPPASDEAGREVWLRAASFSGRFWFVFAQGAEICARLETAPAPPHGEDRPTFEPQGGKYRYASSFAKVDDGWLVGFNQGEWGGALYWFSPDGQRGVEVSRHQIVGFFSLSDGLYAIEGNNHLSSRGSVIRIFRPKPNTPWQAVTAFKLPSAPSSISVCRDDTMLITLSDSLVSVGRDKKIHTLLSKELWLWLYPRSSVLSPDEKQLYIGMRQFVGELDLASKKIRLLIPTDRFLNKLPKEEEDEIRAR